MNMEEDDIQFLEHNNNNRFDKMLFDLKNDISQGNKKNVQNNNNHNNNILLETNQNNNNNNNNNRELELSFDCFI